MQGVFRLKPLLYAIDHESRLFVVCPCFHWTFYFQSDMLQTIGYKYIGNRRALKRRDVSGSRTRSVDSECLL